MRLPAPGSAFFLCLLAAGLFPIGCAVAPAPRRVQPAVAAGPNPSAAIQAASEKFYAGKEAALSGDFACAGISFQDALDIMVPVAGPRVEGPEVNEFSASLLESIARYEEMGREPDTAERRETPDALQDVTVAAAPEEIERARREVGSDTRQAAFDIPITVNDQVLSIVASFQSRPGVKSRFAAGLARSGRYMPMIRAVFEREGLPRDLAYVAMIESSFKTTAHSTAKAHGVWQFIASTGRRYGLRSNRALDERSDPVKATEAAARYFRDLYDIFDDWYLAMAAYDAGEGRIARALARTGAQSYWDLCRLGAIPRETRLYVPSVVAAALIAKNPAHYGFDVAPEPPLQFQTVRLSKPVSLRRLASVCEIDYDELHQLNPELKTEVTPFEPAGYLLRVPGDLKSVVESRVGSLPAARVPAAERHHRVHKGETLARVARRFGVSVVALAQANDLNPRSRLSPQTDLVIPDREGRRRSPGKGKHRKHRGPAHTPETIAIGPEGFERSDSPVARTATK
jgi:membrane-bound lytic murein transglycosylase D